jgi:hypothetical protein
MEAAELAVGAEHRGKFPDLGLVLSALGLMRILKTEPAGSFT